MDTPDDSQNLKRHYVVFKFIFYSAMTCNKENGTPGIDTALLAW